MDFCISSYNITIKVVIVQENLITIMGRCKENEKQLKYSLKRLKNKSDK